MESETITITARLPRELGNWVNSEFSRGFKQKFMHQCFSSLHHILTTGELPPQSEYARAASLEAIERMVGNGRDNSSEDKEGSPRREGNDSEERVALSG